MPKRAVMNIEKRKLPRTFVHPACIVDDAGALIDECTLADISEGGARLALGSAREVPAEFTLLLSRDGAIQRRCRVLWRTAADIGVEFTAVTSDERFIKDLSDSSRA
jgi:hypothetical protein